MNRKLKCCVCLLLSLALFVTTFVVMPLTASADEAADAPAVSEGKADLADVGVTEAPTAETEAPTDPPIDIGAVTKITETEFTTQAMTLVWNAAENAEGYNVYWRDCDNSASKLHLLTSTKGTKLTIKNLSSGAMYEIKVVAIKTQDGKTYEGKGTSIKAATKAKKPANFHLDYADKYLKLAWNKAARCDGFILYRRDATTNGKYMKYKVLSKNTTAFSDRNVTRGKAYYYRLLIYRKAQKNILGNYSEKRAVCGLCATKSTGSKVILNRVFLKWNRNKLAEGYQIFYSTNNKDFKKLTTTKSTSFEKRLSKVGKKYYFKIYPYKHVGKNKDLIYGTFIKLAFTPSHRAFGKDAGNTYVEISITEQHMWYYINGKLYLHTDVVTGNKGTHDTPKGFHRVNSKSSPCTLTGPGYTTTVTYWMAFIGGGYGIHDATWQPYFGGHRYMGGGSHGCVNTPYNAVKKMYKKMKIGTPVIVY